MIITKEASGLMKWKTLDPNWRSGISMATASAANERMVSITDGRRVRKKTKRVRKEKMMMTSVMTLRMNQAVWSAPGDTFAKAPKSIKSKSELTPPSRMAAST